MLNKQKQNYKNIKVLKKIKIIKNSINYKLIKIKLLYDLKKQFKNIKMHEKIL